MKYPHTTQRYATNVTGSNNPSTSTIIKVALENLKTADLDHKVTVVLGHAVESIAKLTPEEPYDLVFIDADKPSNPIYFSEAKRLLRKGGVIVRLALHSLFSLIGFLMCNKIQIVDNVVRAGRVSDTEYSSGNVEGVRNLLKAIEVDDEVEATTIATVGEKGYDGFIYAIKK